MGKPVSVGSFRKVSIKLYLEKEYTGTKNIGSCCISTLFWIYFLYLNMQCSHCKELLYAF